MSDRRTMHLGHVGARYGATDTLRNAMPVTREGVAGCTVARRDLADQSHATATIGVKRSPPGMGEAVYP
jgi:hypothetical protein